jgi:hypothetical protein
MDDLLARDADLIGLETGPIPEVTEADRNLFILLTGAEYDTAQRIHRGLIYTWEVRQIARHRQYGYDQGYYDGRQADGAEERANGRIEALQADKAKMRKTLEQIAYGGAGVSYDYVEPLARFIFLKPTVDPLVEALIKGGIVNLGAAEMAADIREALAKRDLKIVEVER